MDSRFITKNEQIENIKNDIKYLFSKISWTHCYMDPKSTDIVGTIFDSLDKIKQNDIKQKRLGNFNAQQRNNGS